MNRTFVSFPISDIEKCKKQLLHWASQFEVCCFLDNHHYHFNYNSYECILAAGISSQVSATAGNAFNQLKQFALANNDWIFGHLAYDLKNEVEDLQSQLPDGIAFPDLFFFIPETLVLLNEREISIGVTSSHSASDLYREIFSKSISNFEEKGHVNIQSRFSRDEYVSVITKLRQHILKGDCYEINFCQEFFAEKISIDPLQVYFSLAAISPNPFAAFYKLNHKYLCCASPERFIKKEGRKVISQPIKGTWPRDLDDGANDIINREKLLASIKDRTENVMIVDLVRNDLSKICEEGSVQVEELYGVYSYPQVHQMISTVSGMIRKDLHWVDTLSACFPMGSMTGAPKKRVMQLIEQYERTKRGLFSGAVGYVTPEGNFDFNVVIRSILYNQETSYLSYQVGSAITFNSDPETEYEECLLKATAIKKVLS